jgi:hypothetical protein
MHLITDEERDDILDNDARLRAEVLRLTARVKKLEEGSVRRQIRDEARIAKLEKALWRVVSHLGHDASEWEHDHKDEDAEPWDVCRACAYDAMLCDMRRTLAAKGET